MNYKFPPMSIDFNIIYLITSLWFKSRELHPPGTSSTGWLNIRTILRRHEHQNKIDY